MLFTVQDFFKYFLMNSGYGEIYDYPFDYFVNNKLI
jgi:hypothetical protein